MNLNTALFSALLVIIIFEMIILIMNGHCSSIGVAGSERKKMLRSSRDAGSGSYRSKQQKATFGDWQQKQQHNNASNSSNRQPAFEQSVGFGASSKRSQDGGSYLYSYSATGIQGPFSAEQVADSASNRFTWNALARETQNIGQWQTKGKTKVEISEQRQSKRTSRCLTLQTKLIICVTAKSEREPSANGRKNLRRDLLGFNGGFFQKNLKIDKNWFSKSPPLVFSAAIRDPFDIHV